MLKTKYYFAYGSNMNLKQMAIRCPTAKLITKAILNGYKFVYDGKSTYRNRAVANIVESKDDIVEGAVFEIDEKCIKSLDSYEGCPTYYQRKIVEVIGANGKSYSAYVYLRKPLEIGQPSDYYRNVVLQGAKDCKLSKDYIEKYLL